MSRLKLATVETLASLPQINRRLDDPTFAGFLNDVIGSKQLAELKASPTKPPVTGKIHVIPELALTLVPLTEANIVSELLAVRPLRRRRWYLSAKRRARIGRDEAKPHAERDSRSSQKVASEKARFGPFFWAVV